VRWGLIATVGIACAFAGCGGSSRLDTHTNAPIAFVHGGGEIVVIRADGSDRHTLPRIRGRHDLGGIAWSPDGRQLTFDASDFGLPHNPTYADLFVVNRDGSGRRQLTRTHEDDLDPVWSPNNRILAFDRYDDGYNAIWVIDVDGLHARRLTPGIRFGGPVWLPGGREIAFNDGAGDVYVMNADGSARHKLVANMNGSQSGTPFALSPDGRSVALVADKGLLVMNTDGTSLRRVARPLPGEPRDIVWSPDGKHIAFTAGDGHDWEIYVAKADGSGRSQLTDNRRTQDQNPSWSPDSRAIVFERTTFPGRKTYPGKTEIFVMNADGSSQRKLSQEPAGDSDPVWAPNG
jgi:Tol biopolymer transport system component